MEDFVYFDESVEMSTEEWDKYKSILIEEAKWKGIHNIEVVGDRNNGPWIRDQFWDNIVKAFEEMGDEQDEL